MPGRAKQASDGRRPACRPRPRSPARERSAFVLGAHLPHERQRRVVRAAGLEVVDVLADKRLPADVRGVPVEPLDRRGEVVALDEVEAVASAPPDPPVADAGASVRLHQVVGDPRVHLVVLGLAAVSEDGMEGNEAHARDSSPIPRELALIAYGPRLLTLVL